MKYSRKWLVEALLTNNFVENQKLKIKKWVSLLVLFYYHIAILSAQTNLYKNDVNTPKPTLYAFTHATVYIDYKTKIEDATLLINEGKIISAGKNIEIPKDATVVDLYGKYIYPSFIDVYSNYGMPEIQKRENKGNIYNSTKRGPYNWNEAIHPETQAASVFHVNEKDAEKLRNLGFGKVLTHQPDGISRGNGVFVSLANGRDNKTICIADASQHFSFGKGSSTQDYPSSLMGSIALLRQTFYDAQWYKNAKEKETDLSLDAMLKSENLPMFFETNDKWNVLRAAKIAKEFGKNFIIKTSGDEYQRIDDIKACGASLVIPLNFPSPYEVDDSLMTRYIPLKNLMHWEQAPANVATLASKGIEFALTLAGLENKNDFYKMLQKAWQYGLSAEDIVKALTYTPAKYLHAENIYGSLHNGMSADFIICSDSLLDENFVIEENFIRGEKYLNTEKPKVDLTNLNGVYISDGEKFLISNKKIIYKNKHKKNNEIIEIENNLFPIDPNPKDVPFPVITLCEIDTNKITNDIRISCAKKLRDLKPSDTTVKSNPDLTDINGIYNLVDDNISHELTIFNYEKKPHYHLQTGRTVFIDEPLNVKHDSLFFLYQIKENDPYDLREVLYIIDTLPNKNLSIKNLTKIRNLNSQDLAKLEMMRFKDLIPFSEFGWRKHSDFYNRNNYIIKNATVWTAENTGIINNCDVVFENGKIVEIGKSIAGKYNKSFKIIDGTNLHLTPGIVDEHSHIACSGDVNEGTQSVTSEVRIADIINPEDINIYRQLSGGVTTSHILHGSANAIGGQTQLLKLRWGKNAEEMKFEGWTGFIKFALGENVKQSNWGDRNVSRYPQTRMGVEQTILDAFVRATEYNKNWLAFEQSKIQNSKFKIEQPRRNLELDALVEILQNKRHITCHSYVQSEINMLIHIADSMKFKVNTFTHILEGYKVADKMKKHGAAGSTFADWWAYKHEVMEAIPYNAFIMNKIGITTCVNSDDAEMARRLNQEAAKSMKYGNMSDTEAIKLCTINPAKMLHIDNKIGSIKVGKDADIVIWSGNPLSIYSKVLYTFVDGVCYYDVAKQDYIMQQFQAERKRIISKMKEAKKNGEKPKEAEIKQEEEYGCGH